MQDLRVNIIQSDLLWEDIQGNLDMFDQKISDIKDEVDLIILPEVFNTGFPVDPEKYAEDENGLTLNWMREKAKQKKAVITGSILFDKDWKFYNSLIWMNPDGKYQIYSKRHIFHLGDEADTISPGQEQLICQLGDWNIKPLICYDLRFPVWSKNSFKDEKFGYDVLIYVANWPTARSFVWRQLLIARALENQAYVIGVNRVGKDGFGNAYQGDTMIIDPKGQIISDIEPNIERAKTYTLSAKMLTDFRKKFNVGYDWDQFEIL